MKSSLPWPPPKNWDSLWPALKGSLAKIYKPCIRPQCPQCLQGTKHPAFILSFSQKGKRRCMYVPQELVPLLRQGLKNGRRLEVLLYAQGPLLLEHYRQKRDREKIGGSNKTSRSSKLPKKPRKYPITTRKLRKPPSKN